MEWAPQGGAAEPQTLRHRVASTELHQVGCTRCCTRCTRWVASGTPGGLHQVHQVLHQVGFENIFHREISRSNLWHWRRDLGQSLHLLLWKRALQRRSILDSHLQNPSNHSCLCLPRLCCSHPDIIVSVNKYDRFSGSEWDLFSF